MAHYHLCSICKIVVLCKIKIPMNRIKLFYILFVLLFLFTNALVKAQEMFGTTMKGGEDNSGVLFKADSNGENLEVIYEYTKISAQSPYGSLLQASNGKYYGLTYSGGYNSLGVLFEYNIDTDTYTTKVSFDGVSKGEKPKGSLIEASNGKLYGLTREGGTNNLGVLFEFDPSTDIFTKKIDFDGTSFGSYPEGDILEASDGKFYWMMLAGGANGVGTILQYNPATNSLVNLLDFSSLISGEHPNGSLMEASNGKLYTITPNGGASGHGVLIEYDLSTSIFTIRYNFDNGIQGGGPVGSLIEASNGKLYGVTLGGGANSYGVLFEFDYSTNILSKKYDFAYASGCRPKDKLIQGSNGKFYGMTSTGGANNYGVIFKYNPITDVYTNKLDFDGTEKGQNPYGSLIQGSNGNLYGMTYAGGRKGTGVLFEINIASNTFTKKLDLGIAENGEASSGLTEASNGLLYGISLGGLNIDGVLFSINPITNVFSKIIDFDESTSGRFPSGVLFEARNNKLYGVTRLGGSNNVGLLFEYDPVLDLYTKKIDFDASNGSSPTGMFIEDSDGMLYGLTTDGGNNGDGVLFKYDPFTNIFSKKIDFEINSRGRGPKGGLMKASNGKFYGTTQNGGAFGFGTIFEYNPTSEVFTKKVDIDGLLDGKWPSFSLVEAANQKLYGLTSNGGLHDCGVLFEYDPSTNTYTKKIDFDGTTTGKSPKGNLILMPSGNFYGLTYSGGANDLGVLFRYNPSNDNFTVVYDFNGTDGENPAYITHTQTSTYTWDGSESSDWENKENWSDNTKPKTTNSIIIPTGLANYPTISYPAYCNNITLKSDATGDASLLKQNNLTVEGTATVERYVSGYSSNSNGWHLLSSPINTHAINGSDFTPLSGTDDFFRWNETNYEWINYYGGSFGATEFENGVGYLVAYDSEGTKSFSGDLNTASITKNLSFSGGAEDGWNLLGNPFSSAIDWDLLTTSVDVDGSVYLVNPSNGSYFSWNGGVGDISNGEIPINQGFFVKANSAGQSLTMETVDQVHSTSSFNKAVNTPKETLKVSLKGTNSNNNTYIQFREDATAEFDHKIDAYKLFGFAEIAQVYTQLKETKYSINCLSYSTETVSISLAIQVLSDETLEFNFTGIESFDANIRIDLEDLKTGEIINIRTKPVYSFQAIASNEDSRFILHFNGVTAVEDIKEVQAPLVYSFNDAIYIRSNDVKKADILVYNTNGQLVGQEELKGEDLKRLRLKLASGVYMVSLRSVNSVWTKKIYIK